MNKEKIHEYIDEQIVMEKQYCFGIQPDNAPTIKRTISEIKIKNVVVIGNSAQTIHPVAGQGLNTGLRDAFSLSDCIESNSGLANINLLIMEYIKLREIETKKLMRFTEILVKGFSNDIVGINKLRGIALSLLDLNDGFKKTFVRKMSIGR